MGILNDAIREHLELKRKHGASGEDLQRLEKEAFGPPTRPGDPEFEGEEAADSEPADSPQDEDVSPAERGRVDYSHLEDTADHPTLTEPAIEEPGGEPAEPPEAAIFNEDDEQEFGDLELDQGQGDSPAPLSEPGAALDDDEDLEIDFDLSLADQPEPAPPPAPPPPGPAPEFEADDADEDQLEDEDEDLLEETPDFLQDAPEGERLWFEQGEPKDFDFDDD